MDHVGDGDGSIGGSGSSGSGDNRSAGRGRGRGFWAPHPPPQSLRRPHSIVAQQTTSVQQINEMFNNVSMNDVVKNSDLSADAAEFVPRSLMTSQGNQQNQSWHRPSVQDRLTAARNTHGHHESQNHQYGNQQQYPYQPQHMQYQQYADSHQGYSQYDGGFNNYDRNHDNHNMGNNRSENSLPNVLSQLNTAMQTLTRSPDQFENLVVPLVSSLTPHLKTQVNTQAIVSAIILKCISDANFRYSGARLCSHLDAVDTPADDTPSIFRTALFERCREEADTLSGSWPTITSHTPEDEKKCHGLMLCLAELVAQMDSHPASLLGKLLIEVISTALKNPGPNTAKFICQSLKLAGQYLERDSTANRQEIERVMKELSELVIEGRVDQHIGRMVNSVKELRSGNWGRSVSSHGPVPADINQPPQQQVQEQLQYQQLNEPVLYGPDGNILSAEERRFCQDLSNMDDGIDESWQRGVNQRVVDNHAEDEDEDDIIAAAYEEFLKLTPNNISSGVKKG
ncbi:GSCOCG00008752001-RA-CDS [Cotesia congregata]|uniref:Similar to paip1: Polyadenylate-binding protein-interacting protein 1 (Xenopus laevis) n=1 Tax=Cotesia congregata TaxID=51543 RepID=A0A8J2MWY1_COTCN|nr:GSCOCG00008752001-RA-CDS [Cotesia congregata]CAG5102302.1 Similar to paip1: Polyadenylate-binding protein-interacting protein 1 (Xenopus laevis) [Cotesia congregata]